MPSGVSMGLGVGLYSAAVPRPTAFAWGSAPTVRRTGPRRFELALDESALLVASSRALYVDGVNGNDAWSGTSPTIGGPNGPKKSISAAINRWHVNQTIYVKSGWYPVTRSWTGGVPFNGNVNVIAVDDLNNPRPGTGRVTSSVSEDVVTLAWANLGGGVWSAPLANAPYAVVDRATATPTWFTLCALAGDVNVPGEYHYGAGTITVATLTGAAPGATLRILRDAVHNGWLNTALDVTTVGLTFEGGGNLRAWWAQDAGSVTFIDCCFELSKSVGCELNANVAAATHTVRHIRSVARWNTADGLSYTALGAGEGYRVVEYDCLALENGRNAGSNQGSSAHWFAGNGAHYIMRVGGRYAGNEAQEIADAAGAGAGALKTWMLGCQLDGGTVAGNGYELSGDGAAWLDHCRIDRVVNPLATDNAAGIVRVFGTAQRTATGPGTVADYTPS